MKKVLEKKLQRVCQSSRNLDISDVVYFFGSRTRGSLTNGIHLGMQAYSSIWRFGDETFFSQYANPTELIGKPTGSLGSPVAAIMATKRYESRGIENTGIFHAFGQSPNIFYHQGRCCLSMSSKQFFSQHTSRLL